jgi:hypothetical protein
MSSVYNNHIKAIAAGAGFSLVLSDEDVLTVR